MDDKALPSARELAVLWLVHVVLVVWGAWIHVLPFVIVPLCMLSFLTGARVERYRSELKKTVEDTDDGSD